MSKEIVLGNGMCAVVDDEDFDRINANKWSCRKSGNTHYAVRFTRVDGKRKNVFMHREILGLTNKDDHTDHKDWNGLNNQKANLRVCTHVQNRANTPRERGYSKFKGVSLDNGKFTAFVTVNKELIRLGWYEDELEAAKAYNDKAFELYGEFAFQNTLDRSLCMSQGELDRINRSRKDHYNNKKKFYRENAREIREWLMSSAPEYFVQETIASGEGIESICKTIADKFRVTVAEILRGRV